MAAAAATALAFTSRAEVTASSTLPAANAAWALLHSAVASVMLALAAATSTPAGGCLSLSSIVTRLLTAATSGGAAGGRLGPSPPHALNAAALLRARGPGRCLGSGSGGPAPARN